MDEEVPLFSLEPSILCIDTIGSFWLHISGEGQETAEGVRPSHITNILPRFNPGGEFKEILSGIKFAKSTQGSPAIPRYYPPLPPTE